jgi:hypothetical protein
VLHTDATRVAYKKTTYTKPLVAQKRRSSFSLLSLTGDKEARSVPSSLAGGTPEKWRPTSSNRCWQELTVTQQRCQSSPRMDG